MATSIDRLLGGKLLLQQPIRGFRASIDAMLLAAAVDASLRPASSAAQIEILDAGCGIGTASLCLAQRLSSMEVTGLEIDASTADLARDNVARNGLDDRITIVLGDMLLPPQPLRQRQFSAVMTNPPFHPRHGPAATDDARALATMDAVGPTAWLGACLKRVASGGQLVLIHRADCLPALLSAMNDVAGQIEVIPLWPKANGQHAKRVIVRCRKGSRGPASLLPGLVLHETTGKFTPRAEAILWDGAGLDDVLPKP